MKLQSSQAACPIGLLLFVLSVAAYKAVMLTMEMGADWTTFLNLVGLDAFFLSLIGVVVIFQCISRPAWLRMIFRIATVFLSFIYLVDSFVLLALDEHAALFDIGRYSMEPGVVLSFFDARAYGAVILFLISMFVVSGYSSKLKKFIISLLAALLVFGSFCHLYAPRPLLRYAMLSPHDLLQHSRSLQPVSGYSTEQIDFYAGLKRETADIPVSRPNIILLVIESLSSINSKKISGGTGILKGFDDLAEEGILFPNFFANHQASEGGLIALLGGFPPIHFPSATPYMFDEFAMQPSVTAQYRQQGYFTEFLTNSDLGFIGLNHFLEGLGLDRSRGRDEVDSLRQADRIVQDAPSDTFLYDEALRTVQQLSSGYQPFLLTIATTSTHLPYTHPEGGPDTPKAVWAWSMRQLTIFYQRLSDVGYFADGIVLITGDHRQMRPLTKMETERFGGSARARVPLLVIGNGYPAGVVDERFFQQSDLLRLLARIQQPESHLSPHPIWVERYNRKYGNIKLIDNLSVFDEADLGRREYRLEIPGNRIRWLGTRPEFSRQVETRIHAQRSLHQRKREAAR